MTIRDAGPYHLQLALPLSKVNKAATQLKSAYPFILDITPHHPRVDRY